MHDLAGGLRILVSGENLKKGGGQTVLRSTLSELASRPGVDCTALVPTGFTGSCPDPVREQVSLRERPRWSPGLVRRLSRDHDVLFSMGNWAVPSVRVPQVVLCHWPYALYDDPEIWAGMAWRDRLLRTAKRSLFGMLAGQADLVLLQTSVARHRFEERHPGIPTEVLPNVVPTRLVEESRRIHESRPPDRRPRILVLARYYPHKNFEVLLPLAERIARQGLGWTLVTTLDPNEGPGARAFLERAGRGEAAEVIENVGPIPAEGLTAAYRGSAAVLLPSLLESFSGVYLEAMAFGVPVVTSDRDFARAVCGEAATYVDPLDPDDVLHGLRSVLTDEQWRLTLTARGRDRLATFPSAEDVGARLIEILTRATALRRRTR